MARVSEYRRQYGVGSNRKELLSYIKLKIMPGFTIHNRIIYLFRWLSKRILRANFNEILNVYHHRYRLIHSVLGPKEGQGS